MEVVESVWSRERKNEQRRLWRLPFAVAFLFPLITSSPPNQVLLSPYTYSQSYGFIPGFKSNDLFMYLENDEHEIILDSMFLSRSCNSEIYVFSSIFFLLSFLKLDHYISWAFAYTFLLVRNQTLHFQTQSFLLFFLRSLVLFLFIFFIFIFSIITFGDRLFPGKANDEKEKERKYGRIRSYRFNFNKFPPWCFSLWKPKSRKRKRGVYLKDRILLVTPFLLFSEIQTATEFFNSFEPLFHKDSNISMA